jgi:hypothetical protein
MLRHVPHFAWGIVLLFATPVLAQNSALGELYGHGVHAFNSGQYREAHTLLTRAIDSGSEDPRCYYFRGLSYIKLGRDPEAKQDFATGAELEMADSDRFYNVSKSLERIQGRARTLLEQYRSDARLRNFQAREQKRIDRYERIRQNRPNVTIQPGPAKVVPAVEPEESNADVDAPPDDMPPDDLPLEMPAADGDAPDGEIPAEAPNAEDDPFNEDAKPADDAPADKMPAEDPAADQPATDDDPFAEPADGAAKPEDEAPDEEMPADEPSADGDKPANDDDPFADDEPKKP